MSTTNQSQATPCQTPSPPIESIWTMFYWEEHNEGNTQILWDGSMGIGILQKEYGFGFQEELKPYWIFRRFNGMENKEYRNIQNDVEIVKNTIEQEIEQEIKLNALKNYING